MRYVSLDLETTGLKPHGGHQVIELGMVLEDTQALRPVDELPSLRVLFKHETLVGQHFALNMNAALLAEAEVHGRPPEFAWRMVRGKLEEWGCGAERKIHLAGKNVGFFDAQFLPEHILCCFHHRMIEPGSVFMDWQVGPRSLDTLLGKKVRHTALEDARDVVRVLRRAYAPDYCELTRELPLVEKKEAPLPVSLTYGMPPVNP